MLNEKYGFVYIWFDRKHKRYYIGSHWGTETDGYICSSRWMRKSYKRRPEDFKRKILSRIFTTKADLLNEEYKFLSKIHENELGKKYYNLTKHKNGHWFTEDQRVKSLSEKISKKTKEAMYRPDVREKYLNGLRTRDNKSGDPEVKAKRNAAIKATKAKRTPEQREKVVKYFSSVKWWNNGVKNVRRFECPGESWKAGRVSTN